MVIDITSICNMECIHCMNNANQMGNNMEMDTVRSSVALCKKILDHPDFNSYLMIAISGGEPTLHPDFLKILDYICKSFNEPEISAVEVLDYYYEIRDLIVQGKKYDNVFVTVLTNGEWILNNKELAEELTRVYSKCHLMFQVTTDSRYYSRLIDTNDPFWRTCKEIVLCEDPVQKVYPIGRAKTNNLSDGSEWKCSKCFNPRALSNQVGSFPAILDALSKTLKPCAPVITPEGEIKIGESILCKSIGTVNDSLDTLYMNTKNFTCPECDYINQRLPEAYKSFIKFT